MYNYWRVVGTQYIILLLVGISLYQFTDAQETQTLGEMSFGRTMKNRKQVQPFLCNLITKIRS